MATIHRRRFTSPEVQDIVTSYKAGDSCYKLAERYHVSYEKVRTVLKRQGVKLRNSTEAMNLVYRGSSNGYDPPEDVIRLEKERIRRTWGNISEEPEDDLSGVYNPPVNTVNEVC